MRSVFAVAIFLATLSRAWTDFETSTPVDETRDSFNDLDDYPISEAILEGFDIPVKNITCLKRHCTSAIEGCVANEICRKNMMCSARCGTDDSSCTFKCSESYQDPSIDAMVRCMFVDPGCLAFPDPDPLNNATCRNPTNTVAQIN